jgi:hypothetical protein
VKPTADPLGMGIEVLFAEVRRLREHNEVWSDALHDVDHGTWLAVRRQLGIDGLPASVPGATPKRVLTRREIEALGALVLARIREQMAEAAQHSPPAAPSAFCPDCGRLACRETPAGRCGGPAWHQQSGWGS